MPGLQRMERWLWGRLPAAPQLLSLPRHDAQLPNTAAVGKKVAHLDLPLSGLLYQAALWLVKVLAHVPIPRFATCLQASHRFVTVLGAICMLEYLQHKGLEHCADIPGRASREGWSQ